MPNVAAVAGCTESAVASWPSGDKLFAGPSCPAELLRARLGPTAVRRAHRATLGRPDNLSVSAATGHNAEVARPVFFFIARIRPRAFRTLIGKAGCLRLSLRLSCVCLERDRLMEDKLNQLEQDVLQMLLTGNDDTLAAIRNQLNLAKRKPRELSGVGFFTYCDVPQEAPRLPSNPSFAFGDVIAEVDGLQHGAGFVVFIDNGVLRMLEGYTYDEAWPQIVASYRLSYMNQACRDLQSLRATPGWPKDGN